jgi:hypothetical protein
VTTEITQQLDRELRAALDLIKRHITPRNTLQNQDLHAAVQSIVTVCRKVGLLQEHGAR